MLNLKQKMILGMAAQVLILTVASLIGVFVVRRTTSAIEKMFRVNYDSVRASQEMVDALEQVNTSVQIALWRGRAADTKATQKQTDIFEKNLNFQKHNITEEGEEQLTLHLGEVWVKYRDSLAAIFEPGNPQAERRARFEHEMLPMYQDLKATAGQIAELNLKNMSIVEGRSSRMGRSSARGILVLLCLGVVFSAAILALQNRWILRPVRALTGSVREVEKGNFGQEVRIQTKDEIGALGEAFNSMAAALREVRSSNRSRLIRTQRSTQLAINSLGDGVALLGPDGEVELANPPARSLFSLEPGSLLRAGGKLGALLEPCILEGRAFETQSYGQALQVFESGKEKFFLPRLTPVYGEGKELAGFTLVLMDVTSMVKTDEMKNGVVSTVSHELKSPITSLRMAVHLLLEENTGPLNSKQEELLMGAREDSERLFQIVENLLDISRWEAGRAILAAAEVPVQALVLEGLEPFRGAYASKGVDLKSEICPENPLVLADGERIRHVFSNLLENALKHTAPGGKVKVEALDGEGEVRFQVSDSGEGIPMAHLGRVFEKFYRVPGQSQGPGAGLGLAIAREIVEAHGGSINAESKPGEGSVFSFTLKKAGDL